MHEAAELARNRTRPQGDQRDDIARCQRQVGDPGLVHAVSDGSLFRLDGRQDARHRDALAAGCAENHADVEACRLIHLKPHILSPVLRKPRLARRERIRPRLEGVEPVVAAGAGHRISSETSRRVHNRDFRARDRSRGWVENRAREGRGPHLGRGRDRQRREYENPLHAGSRSERSAIPSSSPS